MDFPQTRQTPSQTIKILISISSSAVVLVSVLVSMVIQPNFRRRWKSD